MEQISTKRTVIACLKFIILPLIGIFAFFVDIPIAEYTVMNFTMGARSTIPINHLTGLIRALLWDGSLSIMPFLVLAIALYGMVDLILRRNKHFGNTLGKVFAVIKIIGVIFIVFAVFNIGPGLIHEPRAELAARVVNGDQVSFVPRSISTFVMNGVLITISISIPLAAMFLPFLLNYGLVEFVGVLVRPIMRPLFKLPGRSAVILVSALLGNFSVAHIAVDEQYHKGQMTEREAIAICTGFCSSSIAFMMVLATNTGIIDNYWNAYVWSSFLMIIIITLIGVRIPPVSRIRDGFAPNVTPQPEAVYKQKLFKNALSEGLVIAEKSDNPIIGIAHIMKATLGVLAAIIMGAGFSTSVGMLLYLYTPIFQWIGIIFQPIMMLVQIPPNEVVTAATGTAFSLLEVTIPSMLVMAGDWSYHIRYMMAVVPITSVIFLGSFVPSLISTNLPVKFWHLMVIWLERMILSVLFAGLFALLLFGIPG
ncbi:MAG: hypothetical protein FWC75_05575 [Oscillospiraceae bacterium]|nr:hypothetical protein [Oscillospiraceae bacterium]